ncbi:hypothetical protein, partial [Leifsonia sp. SIMBA_070]|uniref:hypothetical protein n=1 Tax=Leifsonia sp. SIMBA_070 TaxID=3085810 RepID=UPI00397B6072
MLTIADTAHIRGGEVTVTADGVAKTIEVRDGTAALALPAVDRLGEREVTVTVTDKKGRLVSEVHATTQVVD